MEAWAYVPPDAAGRPGPYGLPPRKNLPKPDNRSLSLFSGDVVERAIVSNRVPKLCQLPAAGIQNLFGSEGNLKHRRGAVAIVAFCCRR